MSSGAVGDCEEGRTLRRSSRTRKGAVTPVVDSGNSSGSETDSVETEIETKFGWSGLEREEREWSTHAQIGFETNSETKMSRRDPQKKDSKDSGRGHTLSPGVNVLMQMFLDESRRRDEVQKKEGRWRDEEQKRREEMDRLRRDEEKRERDDERRNSRKQKNLLLQSLMGLTPHERC